MTVQKRNPELIAMLLGELERKWWTAIDTWDPPNMANGAVTSTTIVVTGCAPGDPAIAGHDQIGANDVLVSAHVQAANTVRVVLMNMTGGALNIASGTLTVHVWRRG